MRRTFTDRQASGRGGPRVDLFGPAHAVLRQGIAEVLVVMGRAEVEQAAASVAVTESLEQLLAAVEEHHTREETVLLPPLLSRLSGPLDTIDQAHVRERRFVAELRSLARGLVIARDDQRRLARRTLHLHFTRFAGEALVHMVEEEEMVQPLFERFFLEEELVELLTRANGPR